MCGTERKKVEKQDLCHRERNMPSHIVVLSAQRRDEIIDVCSKKKSLDIWTHQVFPTLSSQYQ